MNPVIVLSLLAIGLQFGSAIEHVHFIQFEQNYLFRGGIPNSNGEFQYSDLKADFASMAKSEGSIVLPDSYSLIDLNLLDPNSSEISDINIEKNYFTKNPKNGVFIQYPIKGEEQSPYSLSADKIKQMALTFDVWSRDKMPAFMDKIRNMVVSNNDNNQTSAIYIHCECGCDRTGQISGGYYMQFMGLSLHDAHALDTAIAGREIEQPQHNALNWYCFYLRYAKNFNLTCAE